MKKLGFLVALLAAIFTMQAKAGSDILSLNPDELRQLELDSIPPWPAEVVLSGTNEHWQKVLHEGEVVVALYEAMPALIAISEPYPYDEFVQVLQGEVTLTPIKGGKQTYRVGESFTVPKGWMGTWDMPVKYREMIVIETKAWEKSESVLAYLFSGKTKPPEANPELLSLNPGQLRKHALDSIPPWPPEAVIKGTNEHWQKELYRGEVAVTIYESMPALLDVSDPFPYDEYVFVLEGEVTLTSLEGGKQTHRQGDSFLVPKGWRGTWDMPVKYREMIVVETKAWVASGE
jgi:uncharacterized cupin superfamily protein